MEIHAVAGVVGGGEGAKASGEGGEAVVGEDLDGEGEGGVGGGRWEGERGEVEIGRWEGEVVGVVKEEGGEEGEEERVELRFGRHLVAVARRRIRGVGAWVRPSMAMADDGENEKKNKKKMFNFQRINKNHGFVKINIL